MLAAIRLTEIVVPSSQDLLRAALRRSEQRGRQVARRRLMWRWLQWALHKLLLWVALPAAAALGAWAWWGRSNAGLPPARTTLQAPASAAAPWTLPPATDQNLRALQLRLDEATPSSAPSLTPRRNP